MELTASRVILSLLGVYLGAKVFFIPSETLVTYAVWGFSSIWISLFAVALILAAVAQWSRFTELFSLLVLWSAALVGFTTTWSVDGAPLIGFFEAIILGGATLFRLLVSYLPKEGPYEALKQFEPKSVQTLPSGFEAVPYPYRFTTQKPIDRVVAYINRTETFTRGQPFPYRVEFIDPATGAETTKFAEGIICNHHGPFLNTPGVISKIDGNRSRSLEYFYGSFAISFRFFRPHRLDMEFTERDGGTEVVVILTTYCRKSWRWLWILGQQCFWPLFGLDVKRRA